VIYKLQKLLVNGLVKRWLWKWESQIEESVAQAGNVVSDIGVAIRAIIDSVQTFCTPYRSMSQSTIATYALAHYLPTFQNGIGIGTLLR
jgi:hypothetical protein